MNSWMDRCLIRCAPWLSPKWFFEKSTRFFQIVPYIAILMLIFGLIGGLIFSPIDYQQSDAFRIIYIHVPAAFLSLGIYTAMSIAAVFSFVWRIKIADLFIKAAAPLGISFTALALITGSIWGKPMWGTWWIWDARLTTELILLFIYLANLLLRSALAYQPTQAQKAVALFTLIGFIDIPLIHFSVNWWQTLHQGATLSRFAKPAIPFIMLWPLLLLLLGLSLYASWVILYRLRADLLWHERDKRWVKKILC